MSKVGCDGFYYAILTKDDLTGVTYSTPVHVPGLININITPSSNSATLYADNVPVETANSLGKVTVSLSLKDLPLEVQAALLGHTVTKGVLEAASTDIAPYVAMMFKSQKGSGGMLFKKYLKVRFAEPEDDNKTKAENVEFQTPTITGEAVTRTYDGKWKREADTEAEGYEATTAASWFTSVEAAA